MKNIVSVEKWKMKFTLCFNACIGGLNPKQVPKNSGGQCFEVEDYFLQGDRFAAIEVLRPGGNGTD